MTTPFSNYRQGGSGEGQPGSVVWFISFGDLLTLLLCFFLVLTPWEKLKNASNAQSLGSVTAQSAANTGAGTALASDLPLRGSVLKLELPLFEGAWEEGGEVMSNRALVDELKRVMPQDGRAEVILCSAPEDRAALVRFVGRAFERGFGSSSAVRFVVSRTCSESLVLAPVTKKIIGRIRIVGT